MSVRLIETYPATSIEQLRDFEQHICMTLPHDYRSFLLATNGGRPVPDGLDVSKWPGKSTRIHFFFGLHGGEHNNLAKWTDELSDRLPTGCLPIAVDMGGNFLILSTDKQRSGEIYYWDASSDYELSDDDGTLFFLSNGVNGVLNALTDSPGI